MTLTFLSTPRVGPGIVVGVHNPSGGAIAADDVVFVSVKDHATGLIVIAGSRIAAGNHNVNVRLGLFESSLYGFASVFGGLADNAAVDLDAEWVDSTGGFIDASVTTAGATWDAVTGLWHFIDRRLTNDVNLASVLAAVTHTFPSST